ncbi:MAG: hypothetical protein LBR75_02945 [Prevotellaceae bacterium]|jgi:hypothetical protein|nr:hypothetical protein [Prevotellaceae bacterium]
MRKLFFTLGFLLFSFGLSAQQQGVWSWVIPVSAVGYASVADESAWSPFQNPAGLAYIAPVEAGVFYQNKFVLNEMATKGGQAAMTTKPVNVGVALSHYGYSEYSEMLLGASLARSFSDKWALGMQFNYYSVMLSPEEGSRGTLLVQIGLMAKPVENLTIGFQAFNPVQQKLSNLSLDKDAPSIYSLGGSYRFSDQFRWSVQLDKEVRSDLLGSTMFTYDVLEQLIVRVGGYVTPFVPLLGVGTRWQNFELNVNTEIHPTLGVSWAAALSYRLPKK